MTSLAARRRQQVLDHKERAARAAVEVALPADPIQAAPPPPMAIDLARDRSVLRAPSLAGAHRRIVEQRLATAIAPTGLAGPRPTKGPAATEYELLLAKLGSDLARLREIRSVEGKVTLKRELMASYDDHVLAVLSAAETEGKALQDEIVATVMLWRLDIGDYEGALLLGAHVVRFGLAMPANIRRTAPTVLAEEVAEAALSALSTGKDFDLSVIDRTMALLDGQDINDVVRSKLYKARGRKLLLIADAYAKDQSASAPAGAVQAAKADALAAFQRAFALDKGAGVKKDIERLNAAVAKGATADQESNTE